MYHSVTDLAMDLLEITLGLALLGLGLYLLGTEAAPERLTQVMVPGVALRVKVTGEALFRFVRKLLQ